MTATRTLWVCADCYIAEVNGELPDDTERSDDIVHGFTFWSDYGDITPGIVFGHDGCTHNADTWHDDYDGHAENCETRDFSSTRCEVCTTRLGGSRHALTFHDKGNNR